MINFITTDFHDFGKKTWVKPINDNKITVTPSDVDLPPPPPKVAKIQPNTAADFFEAPTAKKGTPIEMRSDNMAIQENNNSQNDNSLDLHNTINGERDVEVAKTHPDNG